ncbi:MAG TPA: phosphotransferase [Solirubrobacteraceae bacterium]|nr:phosphotransferase [Solirubrobacteraceae bacterium]
MGEQSPAALQAFMDDRGWLNNGERVRAVARAGEGNMNLTLRVRTTQRSVIVKQARPWCEKYPTIAAPIERVLLEGEWYERVGAIAPLAPRLPRVLAIDHAGYVLLMSDLGEHGDYLYLYGGGRLAEAQLDALVWWLATLHLELAGDERASAIENRAMRVLNHEHIFEVPLRPNNGLALDAITPGLDALAAELGHDAPLRRAIERLGERYLGPGRTLLHGDYYPGSWLQAPEPWVIDPEFGFYGLAEFDVSVMLAHLRLSGQPDTLAQRALSRYHAPLDRPLTWAFAGVEVIRRLLGVSQLPLTIGLAAKRSLLQSARQLVLDWASQDLG